MKHLKVCDRSSKRLGLLALQWNMKRDPEGYESELILILRQFRSYLELFKQQGGISFSMSGVRADSTVVKDLSDRSLILAHVAPFYPRHLSTFPSELAEFLGNSARSLPSELRRHVMKALIFLINRKMVHLQETLPLFMELQTLDDEKLKSLAFSHVVNSIEKMNLKHRNESVNRALQNILFPLLQNEDETKAKISLITLIELRNRKVWLDDRTANAICMACFHPSSRIMIAALKFLLYGKDEDDMDGDASSSDDESSKVQVELSKEAIYKALHKGTTASKKKKKAKLQRAMRSMRRQQRTSLEKGSSNYHSPLDHLKDAQGFAEKLFSRLHACNERFEDTMLILKVVARVIGMHCLLLLNFYPFIMKYVQPHQQDITNLLTAAVHACHDMVPPDAVEPLLRQVVNQFVHDRSRPEAIAVGLNTVREICLRMPLLMTEDLLQDLVLYRKSHKKAVSTAARALMSLFREVYPSMLVKKDRGYPSDPKARPKAYGEVTVAEDVSGAELLLHDVGDSSEDGHMGSDGGLYTDINCVKDESLSGGSNDENDSLNGNKDMEDEAYEKSDDDVNDIESSHEDESSNSCPDEDLDDASSDDGNDEGDVDEDAEDDHEESDGDREGHEEANLSPGSEKNGADNKKPKTNKRKASDFDDQLIAGDSSLRTLKKLAAAERSQASTNSGDGILSNEDFKRIKKLKAEKEAKVTLTKHGLLGKQSDATPSNFKVPDPKRRMDPAKVEARMRLRLSKDERLALVRAGREDRGKYQARTAMKQRKTGGLSNRQKEHMKAMPLAAKRAKIARSSQERKRKQHRGKQFCGKKAWK